MSKTRQRWIATALATLAALLLCSAAASARDTTPEAGADVTNGRVRAIAQVDGKTVIGGDFDYVGPRTGSGVPFTTGGAIATRYPQVLGVVRSAVADGAGGVFVAGDFTRVGGLERNALAHIRSDGTVDAGWDAGLDESSSAYELELVGARLYVTGSWDSDSQFTALRAADGGATGWDPAVVDVQDLTSSGSTLYVAGAFDTVDGVPRNGLAAFDASGALTAWDPASNGFSGYDIEGANGVVYVTGQFSEIGGAERSNIAAIDVTGAATSWYPGHLEGYSNDIVATSTTVYLGGSIAGIDEQTRTNLAAVDAVTGAVTSWAPEVDKVVDTLALSGGNLVVGGFFSAIDGNERARLAAFDTSTGSLLPWNVRPSDEVTTLAPTGGHVYVGGRFTSVGGVTRRNIAALDGDGRVLPWNPDPNGIVRALAVDGRRVVAGGDFTTFAGQARGGLAAVDGVTGSLLSWDPEATGGAVRALTIASGVLHVGGTFTAIDGARRTWLAAFATSDGALLPWATEPTWSGPTRSPIPVPTPLYEDPLIPGVYSLDEHAGTLYAGGLFDAVDGSTRTRVAAFDAASARLLPWRATVIGRPVTRGPLAPRPGRVDAIAVDGAHVFVGGPFISAGGSDEGFAALDPVTGLADGAFTTDGASVSSLLLDGTTLYASFGSVREIDTTTGAYGPWSVWMSDDREGGTALSLAPDGRLDVGSAMHAVGEEPVSGYARFAP